VMPSSLILASAPMRVSSWGAEFDYSACDITAGCSSV